jgi:hypothetical protein
MSTIIGTSIITNVSSISLLYGATGGTGPTGATGPTGGTGATGATGNGVNFIQKINSDGITIFLLDGTQFTITGLSGNSAGSADFLTNPYGVTGATGTNSLSFNIRGSVSGLTATFKPVKGLGGLSLGYQGSDLIFRGLTTASGFGVTNAVLYSAGNTAAPVVDAGGLNNIFRYETHTSGSTTQHVARATISKFLQGKNSTGITNINLIDVAGVTAYVKNFADASVNSFYTSNGVWENKQWYNTSYKDVRAIVTPAGAVQNSGITSTTNIVFRTQDTTPYALQEYGSCCFCDVDKKCLDYVTRKYCNSVSGTFSTETSCGTRIQSEDSACAKQLGACCVNGICVNGTQSLCAQFGGIYYANTSCVATGVCNGGTEHVKSLFIKFEAPPLKPGVPLIQGGLDGLALAELQRKQYTDWTGETVEFNTNRFYTDNLFHTELVFEERQVGNDLVPNFDGENEFILVNQLEKWTNAYHALTNDDGSQKIILQPSYNDYVKIEYNYKSGGILSYNGTAGLNLPTYGIFIVALRTNGHITIWGDNRFNISQFEGRGPYKDISVGSSWIFGIKLDGTLDVLCPDPNIAPRVPSIIDQQSNISLISTNLTNNILVMTKPDGRHIIYWSTLSSNFDEVNDDPRNWWFTHNLTPIGGEYAFYVNGFRDYPNGFNLPSYPYQVDPEQSRSTPVVRSSQAIGLRQDISFITAGGKFNFAAITSNGELIIWGFNAWGLCNIPSGILGAEGHVDPNVKKCVKVSIGDTHVLALLDDGSVKAWGGGNFYGECDIPVGLPPCKDIVAISGYRSLDGFEPALGIRVGGMSVPVNPNSSNNIIPLHTCGVSIFVLQDGSVRAVGKGASIINTHFAGIRVDKIAFAGFLASDIFRDSLGQPAPVYDSNNGNYLFEPVFTRIGNTQEGYYWMNAEYMLSYTELP